MMNGLLLLVLLSPFAGSCQKPEPATMASAFVRSLDAAQKKAALYPFDSEERYNFHFVPKDDRKGIPWSALSAAQRENARGLIETSLSEAGARKAYAVMDLEAVLKGLEGRSESDHYRDPTKYYFTVFGTPGPGNIWGWRLEGHHLSFTFAADKNRLVSGTPAFLGANPAVVPGGPHAGRQVLKEEADEAFALLHSLSTDQLKLALMDGVAPADIITFAHRKAHIESQAGIAYNALNAAQQVQLRKLIAVYVRRYTKLFADAMLKEIEEAGFNTIRFAWAGAQQPRTGVPHYYRIVGPTIVIEYDNTQNGANHAHSVLRDLKRDFGGDLLLEHYRAAH